MLCNFWPDLGFIFINASMFCSCRKIVPSGVTLPFILFVQSKLLFEGFRDLLCRITAAESTENIFVTMKLLQIILHVVNRGLSMVPVTCHKVNMHKVLDAQQGLCEENSLPRRKGLKESPWKLGQSLAQVLSSPYHSIASPGYMVCWIEWSQDVEESLPRAGWICRSWNIQVRGRTIPSSSNA